jgi:hypothetical protein
MFTTLTQTLKDVATAAEIATKELEDNNTRNFLNVEEEARKVWKLDDDAEKANLKVISDNTGFRTTAKK